MTTAEISSVKPKSQLGFMGLLSSAACEWVLIFLLFLDALFSYLLTKFALYCKLQTPCPLCSRIDHVLEKNKPGYLLSLFCSNHKEEISSLVRCHNHGKLADIRVMCEDCIMSFARSRKPTSESYRLLVGKLGVDIEDSGLKILLLSKSFLPDSSGPRTCSCCNKILRAKSNTQRLLQVNPVASKVNVKPPLPRVPSRIRFSRRETMKKLRDKFTGPVTPRTVGSTGVGQLAHVGYTELKITSDSESEVPFSDEDDVTFAVRGKNDYYTEFQQGLQKPRVNNKESGPPKQVHETSEPVPSVLDQPAQRESIENSITNSLEPGGFLQHGLEGSSWLHPNPSALPELISLDDVPQSTENPKSGALVAPPSNLAMLSELISLDNVLSPPNVVEVSETSPDITATSDARNVSVVKHEAIIGFQKDRIPTMPNYLNSDDPLALSNGERKASGVFAETSSNPNYGKPEEYLKSLSWLSTPGIDSSSKDTSPMIEDQHEGFQRSDTPTISDAIDIMQMAAALERHDSGNESIDGVSVKEIEGETVLDRLKRQVDYDRRCMKTLFKELDEERNAAAVAANQTMAMITRLQEEKASLHMEALQYLRMMEEQAEYDMEALEKANDLLAEKEKEMQDLEAELEIYRNKFLDDPLVDDPCEGSSDTTDLSNLANLSESICATKQGSSLASNFDDEKLYISQCLKKLESKLHELSTEGKLTNLSNGGYSVKVTSEVNKQEVFLANEGTQADHTRGENGLSKHSDPSNGSLQKGKSADLVEENHLVSKSSNGPDIQQHELYSHGGEIKLDTFGSEIAHLKDRLEALAADSDILNHALITLRNGNDGLQFIQEIAHQLQELRKVEFKMRSLSIPSDHSAAIAEI